VFRVFRGEKSGIVCVLLSRKRKVYMDDRIQKVLRAMLAMQRRAWEQGVAAQALLELGESELTVLFAKDALVNQLKDGRLGLNEGKSPVTDPAANGEPVLFAARVTGDPRFQKAADRMLEFLLYKAPARGKGSSTTSKSKT
jgi:hypothetical protein